MKSTFLNPKTRKQPLTLAIAVATAGLTPLSVNALTIDDGATVPSTTKLEIRASNITVSKNDATVMGQANERLDIQEGSIIRGTLNVISGEITPSLPQQTCNVSFDIVTRRILKGAIGTDSIDAADTQIFSANKSLTVTIDETSAVNSEAVDFEVEILSDAELENDEDYAIYVNNTNTTCVADNSEEIVEASGYYYNEFGYLGGSIAYGQVIDVPQDTTEVPTEPPVTETPADAEATYKIREATARVKGQLESSTSLSLHNARVRNKNIARELAKRRDGSNGISTSELSANFQGQRVSLAALGAGAGDSNDSAWGGFINGSIEIGDDAQFDISSNLLIAGVDYKSQHWVLGAAYTYATGNSEQDQFAEADLKQAGLSLFASYFLAGFYSNIILSQSSHDYEFTRTQNSQLALGDTDGDEYSYALSAGYQRNSGHWNYRVFALYDATKLEVDGYSESGSDLNFTIDKIERDNQNLEVGLHLNYTLNTAFGVLSPLAEISYRGNTGRKHWSTTALYRAEDTTTGEKLLNYQAGDDQYFSGQVGLSAVFPYGISTFLSYQQDFSRDNWDVKQYDLGIRWEF